MHGYIGTYTTGRSQGIYRFTFDPDTGTLSEPVLFAAVRNPKCVARKGSILASAIELEGRAGVALWDARHPCTPPFSMCCPEKQTPCHLRFSGSSLLAANYHEGLFTVYRTDSHNLSCATQIACGKKAGCHQSLGRRGFILIPCLEQDQVRIFDRKFSPRGVILFPAGSGPRHGIFHPKDRTLWMVTERSHELYHFNYADTRYQLLQQVSILPKDHPEYAASTTAAIRLSPDGRFLYTSTRGADIMSVFALDADGAHLIQQVPCGGKHPRDFILSDDGRYVLVLCRDSDNLFSFPRDAETGKLGEIVSHIHVPEGSSICL
ncbi:lactonase family protein [Butyricicoccus pullicaecorum]|uniref:lactonase family protein n=1 Tax=Butyricicoccus pullicaecorum TaxID=501571 RepID=UPI003521BF56